MKHPYPKKLVRKPHNEFNHPGDMTAVKMIIAPNKAVYNGAIIIYKT